MPILNNDLVRVRNYLRDMALPQLNSLLTSLNGADPGESQRQNIANEIERVASKLNSLVEIERIAQIDSDNAARLADIRR